VAPVGTDSAGLATFIGFAREKLAGQVADVRASDRLTESAVCLVAPEDGYDRQMEKILQNAGRLQAAAKPILEINLAHPVIKAIAAVEDDAFYQEDATLLLLDQARNLDGERPQDPSKFAQRLVRISRGQFGRRVSPSTLCLPTWRSCWVSSNPLGTMSGAEPSRFPWPRVASASCRGPCGSGQCA